jgi:DNA-binding response OmpR family regulator
MNVLIIEDNPDIAANLGDYLEDRGHIVDYAADGVSGQRMALEYDFDVVVLDLMLPGRDGIAVANALKADERFNSAILMLTARDTLENKLEGFDAGADDYVVKPFELAEIEKRVEVLGKRRKPNKSRVLKVADLAFNVDTLDVVRDGKSINLNPIGLKLLQQLMENSPWVVPRRDLEMNVWGEELPDSDSLRVHIHGLRNLIDKPFDTPLIQTRHGIGYRIVDPNAPQT